jgi:hypothetical protein
MVSLTHAFEATGTNNPNKQVSKDRWNAEHDLTGVSGKSLSFNSAGSAAEATGWVDASLFGVSSANSGAANSAALESLFEILRERSPSVGFRSRSIERIALPGGIVNFSAPIELLDGTFHISGAPVNDESGTILKFPAGVTGIRVQTYVTTGASGTRPEGETSSRSIVENLRIDGTYSGTESETYGVHLRAAAIIRNVIISDFAGDGVKVEANAVLDGSNANNFYMETVRVIRCRDGFHIDGPDSNNGTLINCDASANRRWGFFESSFLGNTYIGCHAATNGWVAGAIPTACTHSGNRYYVKVGQAVGASTNAPSGTTADNTWWGYIGVGGTTTGVPAWVSGTTFREGGAYYSDDANARNMFLNCYSEGDQSPAQLTAPTFIIGGIHGAQVKGTAGWFRQEFNGVHVSTPLYADSSAVVAGVLTTGGDSTSGSSIQVRNSSGTSSVSLWSGGSQRGHFSADSFVGTLQHATQINFQIGPTVIGSTDSTGLNLASGKVMKVNSQQVVGARGAALPADASDLATALTLVNAIKARMKATGGHGLVSD